MLLFMESYPSHEQSAYVGQLVDHALTLQREARAALATGDFERASALIDNAELLADDVHGLVNAIEQRQSDALLRLVAQEQAACAVLAAPGRTRNPRAIRMAIGASLAMSLALVEC